jgi:hypothetical protein
MQFSGTHQTKAPLQIGMKISTFGYVVKITKHAENGYNLLAGYGAAPYIGEM